MKFIPHSYQSYCIDRIVNDRYVGLLLDMGLGKTVIALTAANELIYNRFAVGKVLVIAPKKVAETTWTNEAGKWDHLKHLRISRVIGTLQQRIRALNTPADIYVINRENIPWLVDYDRNGWRFDMVIIDELSSFKSSKAQRFKSLCWVRPHINRLIGLTGTPASNGLTDLWAQIYLLDEGQRLGKKITHFRTKYCDCNTHGGHFSTYEMKPGAEEAIRAAISDICISMKADDYISLPECVVVDVPVYLAKKTREQYEEFEREMLLDVDENTLDAGTAAVLSGKLMQFANGAVYDDRKNIIEIHRDKLEVLSELVEGLNGQPALIFYNFRHDLERIKAMFEKTPLRIRELKNDRDQADWNAGKIDLLLAHPASAGYGLNLQEGGSHIIWFGLNWSLELYEQANKRLHRQGQKNRVIIHRLITAETRDEDVAAALAGKRDVQNALLEALKVKIRELKGKETMELIVDNFAGGGGASTGIELATGRAIDIAINHDMDAILMHKTNHPLTQHYCESVWDVNPAEICAGNPVALMWLSPDCKHFSRAKGGKPVDKNVRGLAWIAARWAATVRPRVIILENVPEFTTWGPLGKDNKPDKKRMGETFRSFVRTLESLGYEVKWKELKACDFGAPTIRKRFFLIARCDNRPIVFPEPTHGAGKLPYRTAAECIDWSIPCKSIFERDIPLKENTMRRIARGLDKFTIKAEKPFIINYKFANEPESPDNPVSTITSVNSHYTVVPSIQKYFGGVTGSGIDKPLGTVTAWDHNALLAPSLIQYHSEQGGSEVRGQALSEPLMTIDASPRYGLTAANIVKYYSGADQASSCGDPLHTITTKDRNALVESHLCVMRNGQDCKPLTEPLPTECTSAGHFAEIRTHIEKYPPSGDLGHWREVRELLNKHCGYSLADDEILILEFGGESWYISDIGMRMLAPRELYNAQGFPPDYIIDRDYKGNAYPKAKQVARCGNAVPPPFAEALVRANLPELCGDKISTMEELRRA